MSLSEVNMAVVKANPYRRVAAYPIIKEKVEALKESIETTGWWENIVGRRVGKTIEVAYGHHRLEALKQLGYTDFSMLIHEMDEDCMAQMMVRENDDVYSPNADTDREALDTIVQGVAKGALHLPDSARQDGRGGGQSGLSFTVSGDTVKTSVRALAAYTGWSQRRVQGAVAQLQAIQENLLDASDFKGMNVGQAERTARAAINDFTRQTKGQGATPAQARKSVRKVAKEVAKETREKRVGERLIGAKSADLRRKRDDAGKVPDINTFAVDLAKQLEKVVQRGSLQADQLEQVTQYRGYLSKSARTALESSIASLQSRLAKASKELGSPVMEMVR